MTSLTTNNINTSTKEGRYLLAAIAKITTESQTDKSPDDVLQQLDELQQEMFKDAEPIKE